MLSGVKLIAVLAAAAASLGVSFVWFTVLFPEAYLAGLGRSQAQLDAGPSIAVASAIQFAGFVLMAGGLAWLMRRTGMTSSTGGLTLGLICWAAFFAAIIGPMYAYQAFSLAFFAIVAGGYLAAFLVAGLIVGTWR